MISFKKILVPTDFSDLSGHALAYGRSLTKAFAASLHILHVVTEPFQHGFSSEDFVVALPVAEEEQELIARRRLEELVDESERESLRARLITRIGNPYLEIIRYAQEERIDLIVMGTHGHGLVAHLLLGSVAEKTIRNSPCAVLAVRHPGGEPTFPEPLRRKGP